MKGSPSTNIKGMSSGRGSDSERLGFDTGGYIVKKGTPQGEGAMFNRMPPGMDIDNQDVTDINNMPFKCLVDTSYPGDGWGPRRDIPE
jgi:hypothetical protein